MALHYRSGSSPASCSGAELRHRCAPHDSSLAFDRWARLTDIDRRRAEREFATGPTADTARAVLTSDARAGGCSFEALAWALDVARWDALPDELQRAVVASVRRLHSDASFLSIER